MIGWAQNEATVKALRAQAKRGGRFAGYYRREADALAARITPQERSSRWPLVLLTLFCGAAAFVLTYYRGGGW